VPRLHPPSGTCEELRFQIHVIDASQAGTNAGLAAMIVVDPSTGVNVTLDLDASGWFKAADGSKLDPADAAAVSAIDANIRASVRVVHDDDHDDHGSGG
jgi:hypothetical protein